MQLRLWLTVTDTGHSIDVDVTSQLTLVLPLGTGFSNEQGALLPRSCF